MPVTDEKAPKTDDFGVLVDRAAAPPAGAALVFNCQMGRGRTTTGMVIATLLAGRATGTVPLSPPSPPLPLLGERCHLASLLTASRVQVCSE